MCSGVEDELDSIDSDFASDRLGFGRVNRDRQRMRLAVRSLWLAAWSRSVEGGAWCGWSRDVVVAESEAGRQARSK